MRVHSLVCGCWGVYVCVCLCVCVCRYQWAEPHAVSGLWCVWVWMVSALWYVWECVLQPCIHGASRDVCVYV